MPIKDEEKKREAQKRANDKRRGARTRGWACIVYPESAPEGWISKLNEAHIQTLISPLHDRDVTAEKKPKKPHHHVLAMFDNPVPESTAKAYFERIGVTAPPEKIDTIKGYARYLIHLDDHDKAKYSESDVIALAGASWRGVALDEAEEVNSILDEIESWIDESHCISYGALCRYARYERTDWTRVIRKNTIHLSALLRSMEWEAKQQLDPASVKPPRHCKVDLETGEVTEEDDVNG